MLMFPWKGIWGLGIPKSSLVLMNALLMYRFTMEKIALTKRFYNSILISQRTYFFVKCQPLSCGSSQTGLQWQCKVNSTFFQILIIVDSFWCKPLIWHHQNLQHRNSKIPSKVQLQTFYSYRVRTKPFLIFQDQNKTRRSNHQLF